MAPLGAVACLFFPPYLMPILLKIPKKKNVKQSEILSFQILIQT